MRRLQSLAQHESWKPCKLEKQGYKKLLNSSCSAFESYYAGFFSNPFVAHASFVTTEPQPFSCRRSCSKKSFSGWNQRRFIDDIITHDDCLLQLWLEVPSSRILLQEKSLRYRIWMIRGIHLMTWDAMTHNSKHKKVSCTTFVFHSESSNLKSLTKSNAASQSRVILFESKMTSTWLSLPVPADSRKYIKSRCAMRPSKKLLTDWCLCEHVVVPLLWFRVSWGEFFAAKDLFFKLGYFCAAEYFGMKIS